MHTLPFELVTEILEEAYEQHGVQTPKSCALVCTFWHAASRPLLFRRIRLPCAKELGDLTALLTQDPSLAPLVRTLVLRDDCCNPGVAQGWGGAAAARLPALLPNVTALEFAGIREWFPPPPLPMSLSPHAHVQRAPPATFAFPRFPRVRSLALRGCTVDAHTLAALAARLPALDALALAYVAVPHYAEDAPAPGPALRALTLDMGHVFSSALSHVLPWVLTTPSADALRTLTFTLRPSDAEAAGEFLLAVGPRLEELEVRFEEYFGLPLETTNVKGQISFKKCTRLRSLTLFDPNPTSAAIISSIEEVRSPHLRKLALRIFSRKGVEAGGSRLPSLAPLAAPLKGENMKGLTELAILHQGPMAAEDVTKAVQADLPELFDRGIVRIFAWT